MNVKTFKNYLNKLDILSYYEKEKGDDINWK
jgi:hypothetical protein